MVQDNGRWSADSREFLIRSISGLVFVHNEFNRTRTPSVISMSFGGNYTIALDIALSFVSLMTTDISIVRVHPWLLFRSLTPASLLSSQQETIIKTLPLYPPLVFRQQSPSQPRPLTTPKPTSPILVPVSTSGLLALMWSRLISTTRLYSLLEHLRPPHTFQVSSLIYSASTAL